MRVCECDKLTKEIKRNKSWSEGDNDRTPDRNTQTSPIKEASKRKEQHSKAARGDPTEFAEIYIMHDVALRAMT